MDESDGFKRLGVRALYSLILLGEGQQVQSGLLFCSSETQGYSWW
jgi:hypothetical protein